MASKFRKGNQALSTLKAKLRALPVSLAHKAAQRVGPALRAFTAESFDAGRTVYGEDRPKGKDGQKLDLEESGATKRTLSYGTQGRVVRVALGTPHAKFLIGKYRILPNGAMPVDWHDEITSIVHTVKADLK